ncbi:cytolytic toxin-alpha-like isoform X1 [Macrobrachium rosenbergii]|uniref:cytolytic toxin-alpha-like isoform X1 n=1 Tax=Macrobrachium rosenbergii TaxID=79674 RepID=UPI0034D72F49
MVNGLSEEPLSIPTLGRPFFLGMLYDCRSDKILLGVTLWEKETLNVRDVQRHESADFEIIASDTIEDKSSALDVKAGLKLSYLGGMVDVSGSGKYLENRKSSNHVERVTLKYKCTTKTEIMTMEQLGKGKIEHPEVFDHGTATHVVTGITYGGNAYFVFEKELSSDSFDKNVSGNLHIMVNSIPSLKIDGKGQLDLSENETKETQKFRGRYFGDFLPQDNPLTFEEAVRLYKRIPNVIGEKGENSVPISASLYPLAKLDSKACKLVREISAVLVKETENYLEDLYELDVKCNDLLRSQAVNNFRGIEAEIQKFKSLLATYKLGFQKEVTQILPSIRGGNKEESQLAIILKKRESSPFRNEALNRWLEAKETQVKILLQYISYLHEIKFVSKTDLSPMIKNPKHSQILCFSILIPESDSHLINMLKYLKEEDLTSDLDFTDENAKLPPRITENESSMMEKARNFREFFDNNKENTNVSILVTEGVSDSNELQAKIMYYENGKPINGVFAIPSAPRKICVDYSGKNHFMVHQTLTRTKLSVKTLLKITHLLLNMQILMLQVIVFWVSNLVVSTLLASKVFASLALVFRFKLVELSKQGQLVHLGNLRPGRYLLRK